MIFENLEQNKEKYKLYNFMYNPERQIKVITLINNYIMKELSLILSSKYINQESLTPTVYSTVHREEFVYNLRYMFKLNQEYMKSGHFGYITSFDIEKGGLQSNQFVIKYKSTIKTKKTENSYSSYKYFSFSLQELVKDVGGVLMINEDYIENVYKAEVEHNIKNYYNQIIDWLKEY